MQNTIANIETDIEEAQTALETTERTLNRDHETHIERVRETLEQTEDAIDDYQDLGNAAARADARQTAVEATDTAQTQIDQLQEVIGYDDPEPAKAVETLDDAIEDVEDGVDALPRRGDGPEEYYVVINGNDFDVPERVMTPFEILRQVSGYSPNEYVLYRARDGRDSEEGDDYLPKDGPIDLVEDFNRFTAYKHRNPYGRV